MKNKFSVIQLFAVAGFVILSCTTCKLIDKLLTFRIDDSTTIVIPATTIVGLPLSIDLGDQEVETNSSQEFDNNNTKKDLVKEIILEEIRATILSPENQTFSPLNQIEVYISSTLSGEKLIAWKYNIPDNIGRELELETTDELLDEYVKEDRYTVRVSSKVDETIAQNTEVEINFTFKVTADPL